MAYLKTVEETNKRKEEYKKENRQRGNWIYKNIYNTSQWKKLRKTKLAENPLCEECLKKGKYKLATLVHHKKEISSGKTEEEMKTLAFDYDNLQSLCDECHKEKHNKENNYFMDWDEKY